jgi:hypothetical protein
MTRSDVAAAGTRKGHRRPRAVAESLAVEQYGCRGWFAAVRSAGMGPWVAVFGAAFCVAAGTGLASASGSQRSYTMPFSGGCGHHPPTLAPHLLGSQAQFTVPTAWSAVRELTPGTICARGYLLINPPASIGPLCDQGQVYAQAAAGFRTPAPFLHSGFPVLGRGALPAVAGMRGAWGELDLGGAGKYRAYEVLAGYEAANHRLLYELIVIPPSSHLGDCHTGGGLQARIVAIQIARSFRVAVTDPSTPQTFS